MSDDKERGFRDDHGAALERAARLQEENDALRAELAEARRAKTDPPAPPKASHPNPPAARVGLAIALVGALIGASFAIGLRRRAPPPPPPYVNVPLPTFTAPLPSFAFEGIVMPPILMEGVPTASRPVVRRDEKVVEVRSRPSGASIMLEGRAAGKTPSHVRFDPTTCPDNLCRATLTSEGHGAATLELGPDTIGVVGHDFVVNEKARP